MQLTLDHRSPVPLYHQLAESIRYRIATGELKSGTVLPPLRRAAGLWGVHLHTVRRAYAELARSGVVSTHAPEGTRVLPAGAESRGRPAPGDRERFLKSVVAEARLRYGLSAEELSALIRRVKAAPARPRSVSVVECSRTQSEDLAGQIEQRWRVSARPWVLGRDGVPPPGLVVATYFHYNDVRLQWPDRLPDVRFLAISPEADLARRLRGGRVAGGRSRSVILCERDGAMARNISADLARVLPAPEFKLVSRVAPKADSFLKSAPPRACLLFSPRLWGELPEGARRDPRVHQVRYVFDSAGLDSLAAEQGWESR